MTNSIHDAVTRRSGWLLTRAILAGSPLFLGTACDGDSPRGKLLHDNGATAVLAAEQQRLHQMQLLRVIDVATNEPSEIDLDGPTFFGMMFSTCNRSYNCNTPVYGGDAECRMDVCDAAVALCKGQFMLAMVTDPVSVTLTAGTESYLVPPQTAATNAKLAERAALELGKIVDHVVDATMDSCAAEQLVDTFWQDQSRVAALGATFVEGYHATKTAYDMWVKNTLAVADSELSSSPSKDITAPRAISKKALSRSAVAHAMVGGPPGFMGSETEAFCTAPRLDGPAQTALSVLREAAPPPADILNAGISTDSLVNGAQGPEMPSDGSVKDRLGELWGTAPASNLFDLYHLKRSDFDAARRSMKDEIKIFSRSMVATLPRRTPSGALVSHKHYAATATKPPERDPVYWTAIALTESLDPSNTLGGVWRSPRSYNARPLVTGDWEYSRYVDNALSSANYIVQQQGLRTGSAEFVSEVQKSFINPLTLLLTNSDREGRLVHCNDPATGDHTFTAMGYSLDDNVKAVLGEDQLACATAGTIEGAPCGMDLTLAFDDPDPAFMAFNDAVTLNVPVGSAPLGQRMYVIKPKLTGNSNAGPGDWEALVGFPVLEEGAGASSRRCRDIPIVSEARRTVAQALAPSREWCGASAVTCAGRDFDERLPLEDELTNDNDGIESSWKHYLALAHEAAEESDRLGEDYIAQSLARDTRKEDVELRKQAQQEKAAAALERLQDICGTSVDPVPLVKALGGNVTGDFDLSEIDQGPCPDPGAPPPGTTCRHGRAVKDWLTIVSSEPELEKLADCVATFAATTTMHLGDKALCAWKDGDTLCGKAHDAYRCPDVQVGSTCSTPAGTTAVAIPKEDGLNFFKTSDTLPPPIPATICDTIRELRKTPSNDGELKEKLDQIVASNLFNSAYLAQYRERLEFEATYGNFINLKVDGNVLASTGSASAGVGNTTDWPCSNAADDLAPNCDTKAKGLFCAHYACDTATGLQAANERLFNAAVAAQLTTSIGSRDAPRFWLPAYLINAVPDGGSQTTPGAFGVPLTRLANDRWRMFKGDVAANHAALNAHALGGTYTLKSGATAPPGSFAFEKVAPRKLENLLQAFWGGMSEGAVDVGYFYELLTNGPENLDRSRQGQIFRFGENLWIDRDMSNSCTISPFCDGDQQLLDRVKESLKAAQLTSGNPTDEMTYTTHSAVTYSLTDQSVADGLELICEVAKGVSERSVGCNLAEPPLLQSPKDLDKMGNYLSCLADEISTHAALQVFPNFPVSALDPLRQAGSGPASDVNGEMGRAVSELRSALGTVASSGPAIGRAVKLFGEDMKRLKAVWASYDIDDKMADVRFNATMAQQLATCLQTAIESVSSSDPGNLVTMGMKGTAIAAVACMNSAAQIGFADSLRDLEQDKTKQERQIAAADFNQRFIDHNTELQMQSIALSGAIEMVIRQLGVISDLRHHAERAVNEALWAMTTHASGQAAITSVYGIRSAVAKTRYVNAHDNAKHMAFLARRAIEQRLGVPLDEMTETLPLVDAPSKWVSNVCTTSAVKYETLAGRQYKSLTTGGGGSGAASGDAAQVFADSYIGDYVDKLERVVESYRLTKNFHEGTDTAVVSLRDDVFNVRAECDVESPNLLFHAAALDESPVASPPIVRSYYQAGYEPEDPPLEPRRGWEQRGCASDASGQALANCITPIVHNDPPFVDIRPAFRTVRGFKLRFGDGGSCPAATCGYRTGAHIAQDVSLPPGRYRYSWYTPDNKGAAGAEAGFVSLAGTNVMQVTWGDPATFGYQAMTDATWARRYFVFDVVPAANGDATQTFSVGFSRPTATANDIEVAAPMLERLNTLPGASSSPEPKIFSNTTDVRSNKLAVCQDTGGAVFRQKVWSRHCVRLCPDGYSSDCRDRGTETCYWEAGFHISQRGIEAGNMFNQSGFARGNFNYRIESIVPNFVGTSLRRCEDSEVPQSCYSAGFIPYSLIHEGPYYVRNHVGVDYEARLFTGQIEHARGLGNERYITNPVSEADRSLLEPFKRLELQGRPLDGQFTLRVWEEPGIDFHAIEDVQLVLNYRYWTRFN